ncbi:HD-GYP domain-containing protein [Rhizobacter sp. LjRoot28]|uniref:HD-GYP domain-containing protein n=1 Tax=Rhizobacter sp. LjRoot28 TaxID=3342309 RepID=UPI003ECD614A
MPTSLIDVQQLRIGMFVHLDMGWMSHPFPLSSFKITSADQIVTIRGLGKPRVRWSPDKSDPDAFDAAHAPSAGLAAGVPAAAVPPAGTESPQAALLRQRRDAVAASRARLHLCERQFAEAARACRQATELVAAQPDVARQQTEALSQALVDKLIGDQDMCIRLLTDAAGDKASLHAMNVTVISLLMGRTFGLSPADMLDLGTGALLHDIGKLDLPERVRHREEHFTTAETTFYQEHVAHGVTQAKRMGLKAGATLVVAQHHEHADGSGFPLKLNSDRMTTAARIVSLVNRYDNLCNPHVPARALTPHESLSLLFAQGKNRYDTAILGAFIRMMGVYPPGSAVQLTDDRYALVVSVNSTRPLKPTVLVHDPKVPSDEAVPLNLESDGRLGIRRSVKVQQLPAEALAYLSPRPRIAYFFEPNIEPERADGSAARSPNP